MNYRYLYFDLIGKRVYKFKNNLYCIEYMDEYGDFEEVQKEGSPQAPGIEMQARARLPRNGELIGVILQRYGGSRMEIKTSDGKSRNCRVPGKYRKSLWLRPRDIVLILPWKDDDSKGDVIYKYNGSQASQLAKRGLLQFLDKGF